MNLLDQLNSMTAEGEKKPRARMRYTPPGTRPHEGAGILGDVWGRKAAEDSSDLRRILEIPTRPPPDLAAIGELMKGRLRRERSGPCACASLGRECITRFKPVQAWALFEMGIVGGLLGPIVVGGGKTGLDILAPMVVPRCRTAVLLVPPNLVAQLVEEYKLWAEHWNVPSLVLRRDAFIVEGAPALHVIPYSRLSRAESTILLETLSPDLIVADEAHMLRHRDSVRTDRVLRYFRERPSTRLCAWSGSLTDKSIKDYAHLSALALRRNSPVPIKKDTIAEWSAVIDPPAPGQEPAPIGALAALCNPGESVRSAFRRRLTSTRGVVATDNPGIPAPLFMHERNPGAMPDVIASALADLRNSWQRPDGEELVEAFAVARCARELASGFYYRWVFPRGEPVSLILRWFEARAAYAKEVREKLKRRQPHLDQPMLLAKAAIRHYAGYEGPLPTWASKHWPEWRDIRGQVKPESEAVWLSEYLARDAAEWALENRGIVWYEHTAFGKKVAELSGLPLHAGGPGAGERLAAEKGDRSIIASIKSHGTGRDGLQRLFYQQLIANPPVSKATGGAARWEQLLGRLHREGQKAPQIDSWIYRHTEEMRDAWDRAHQLASYVTQTIGSYQKLLSMTETWR